jgi:hypothetical protein
MTTPSRLLRGNADAAGGVTYTNVTGATDATVFDTVNPAEDVIVLNVPDGVTVIGITLILSTAAALTGAPVADVYYKSTSGAWVTAAAIVTPTLTALGAAAVTFTGIAASSIALIDDLLAPRVSPQIRCLFLRFTGITAVTTAPTFATIQVRASTAANGADTAGVVAQMVSPTFTHGVASPDASAPALNDLDLFGFDEKPLSLRPTVYRPGLRAHKREWVYSKADGTFPTLTPIDPTGKLTGVASATYTARSVVTTTAGTWGTSGTFSDVGIAGDGWVEGTVGASPTLGGFLGLSVLDDAGVNYTGIDYGWHIGHAVTAFCSPWINGVQQSSLTFPLVQGDVLRLHRVGTFVHYYQNDVLRFTASAVPAGTYKIDTAFISGGARLDNITLVSQDGATETPVAFTWVTATAVTQSSATIPIGLTHSGLAAARSVSASATTHDISFTSGPSIAGAWSIACWVNCVSAAGNATLIDVGSYGGNNGFGVWLNASRQVGWRANQNFNNFQPALTLPLGLWSHVAVTYDGATIRMYQDGVQVYTTAFAVNPTAVTTAMRFFRRDGASTEVVFGRLDEVMIFSRAITAAEVKANYGYGYGVQGTGTETGLAAAWHLDETSGATVAAYAGGFTGTITGVALGQPAKPGFGAVPTAQSIGVAAPADFAKTARVDSAGVPHTRYWIGLKTTADAALMKAAQFTLRGVVAKGVGTNGIPAPATETFTRATVAAREASLSESKIEIVNVTSGASVTLTVPANTTLVTETISLPVAAGDKIAVMQTSGHASVNLGDGAVYLSS